MRLQLRKKGEEGRKRKQRRTYQERVVEKERMELVAKSWLFHPGGSSCNKQAERKKSIPVLRNSYSRFFLSISFPSLLLSLSSNERIENVQDLRPFFLSLCMGIRSKSWNGNVDGKDAEMTVATFFAQSKKKGCM